jgi:acetyl esterase/lipase
MSSKRYLAGHPADDRVVCPLNADLTGLPPMLVQAATGDPVLDDATRAFPRIALVATVPPAWEPVQARPVVRALCPNQKGHLRGSTSEIARRNDDRR